MGTGHIRNSLYGSFISVLLGPGGHHKSWVVKRSCSQGILECVCAQSIILFASTFVRLQCHWPGDSGGRVCFPLCCQDLLYNSESRARQTKVCQSVCVSGVFAPQILRNSGKHPRARTSFHTTKNAIPTTILSDACHGILHFPRGAQACNTTLTKLQWQTDRPQPASHANGPITLF